MKCKCKEQYDKIIQLIASKEKDFKIAYQDGPHVVRKVKYEITKDVYELLKTYELCNCFLGQNLQRINNLTSSFFERIDYFVKELNPTAFENEKDKLFDKINLILNTK